jgi:hypothetical protein
MSRRILTKAAECNKRRPEILWHVRHSDDLKPGIFGAWKAARIMSMA